MRLTITIIATTMLAGIAACTTASQSDFAGMSFSEEPLTGFVEFEYRLVGLPLGNGKQCYVGRVSSRTLRR